MPTLRAHPVMKVGLLLVMLRLAGLVVRYLAQPGGSIAGRLALFLPAASAHVGALLMVVALLLIACRSVGRLPALRRPVIVASCAICAVLMIAGQADLTVSSITGAPLTPTVFRTFRGVHVVTSNEFLEPLKANALVAGGGLAMFAGVIVWMASVIRLDSVAGRDSDGPASRALGMIGAGALLLWLPRLVPWPAPPPPIEVAFAAEYFGLDRATLRGPEADAVRELRALLGLPPHMAWLSDEYPLVYGRVDQNARIASAGDRPDIVVVMIESLRGAELSFVTGAHDSVSPNLDAMAARGVVFPTFTSNGFPSAPSVLAFHCSAWPHRRKEIITDFADRRFDCLPSRLRDFGYETTYDGADPHFDNQDRWLPLWYSTVIDLVAVGLEATDHNIVSRGIDEIRRHDAHATGEPLFELISTYSTHYPFRLPADAGEGAMPASADLAAHYRQVLKYTDRELGILLAFLETRARRDRTLTIVVGDHGFYTDLRRTSGLPENDNIWTAAVFVGPADLIGMPRRIPGPASHVDMLPTLLALADDNRPSSALGRNLFGPPRDGTATALAVRPGGLRLDRDGYAMMVDARMPNVATSRVAFPGLVAPVPSASAAVVGAAQLTDWVTDWSYLVEHDRVWSPPFLTRQPAPVSR